MHRVAGTPQARKAWLILRGPYLAAYTLIMITPWFLGSDISGSFGEAIWDGLLAAAGLTLVIGSVASFVIVAKAETGPHWSCLELLEITGLRALIVVQTGFVLASALASAPVGIILMNALLGLFGLGILTNLTWNRGKGRRERA